MIQHIATVAVYVDDPEKASRFRGERVELQVKRKESMGPADFWLELEPQGSNSNLVVYPKALMSNWEEH